MIFISLRFLSQALRAKIQKMEQMSAWGKPTPMLARIELALDTLRAEEGSFVSDQLKEALSDLVFSVQTLAGHFEGLDEALQPYLPALLHFGGIAQYSCRLYFTPGNRAE